MVTRRNLAIVPALKVDASTWFPTTTWLRITGAHASLPRSTAFRGTVPAQIAMTRATTVPGRYYVVSVSVRFIAPSTGRMNIDWYTGGNVFLSPSTNGPDFSQAANTTARFAVLGQAPANAVRLTGVLNGIDGEAQVTAYMVEEFTTLPEAEAALAYSVLASSYFDGDTPGATWDGADGESTSTWITDPPVSGESTLPAPQAFGLGKRASQGTGLAELLPPFASTGLFATASYDDRRGRIRLDVQGLAPNVVRVIVYSRPKGTSRWRVVRGGRVAVAAGTTVRRVDDYEWTAGRGVEYRIDALSSAENITPESVVQSAFAELDDTLDQAWLKFIPAPHTNLKVRFIADKHRFERASRVTIHRVAGRADPIAVTDVHDSKTTSVRFLTRTDAEFAALDKALAQGAPAYLQLPESTPFPSMYIAIGNISTERVGRAKTSRSWLWTVAVTEVAAPPPSIVGSGMTWGALLEQYETWGDVLEAFATWGEVIG
jgi:hypothetical protein